MKTMAAKNPITALKMGSPLDSLEIHWFKHENGTFSFNKICNVDLESEHEYELTIRDWDYQMRVDGTCVWIPRNCPYEGKRYQLYPYFGGQETAPHDIKIKIKKGTSH